MTDSLQETTTPAPSELAQLVAPYGIRRCRDSHWHVTVGGEDISDAIYSEAAAWEMAMREWAESHTDEQSTLLDRLATAEEDRFNESGVYIPNEIPAKLRAIALDLPRLTYEAAELRATLATQARTLEDTEARAGSWRDASVRMLKRAEKAEAALDALREAATNFVPGARHSIGCSLIPCNCGLSEMVRTLCALTTEPTP